MTSFALVRRPRTLALGAHHVLRRPGQTDACLQKLGRASEYSSWIAVVRYVVGWRVTRRALKGGIGREDGDPGGLLHSIYEEEGILTKRDREKERCRRPESPEVRDAG